MKPSIPFCLNLIYCILCPMCSESFILLTANTQKRNKNKNKYFTKKDDSKCRFLSLDFHTSARCICFTFNGITVFFVRNLHTT
jgi:hypothetical protein